MKRYLSYALVCVSLCSCNVNENIPNENNIISELKLYDINGIEKNVLKYGDEINIKFSVANCSDYALTYHFTGEAIIFKIFHDDSVYATSIDGAKFTTNEQFRTINPGELLKSEWLAPNTWGYRPHINKIFPLGNYKVIVQHNSLFDNYILEETKPVYFSVIKAN
jgi:hypothetical protein